jgi:two-component system response regulator PilR (NtrC family)
MIALLEDNHAIAQFIVATLTIYGCHVEHFSDGAAFLTALQSGTYDMVVTDFMLPGEFSGFQVVTALQERFPTLPIIVITAASRDALASLHALYPAIPILWKPFKMQDLLQTMGSLATTSR